MPKAKSPVIELPNDRELVEKLERKLQAYKARLERHANRHPALNFDTICKIAVLERLLRDGRVETWKLSLELGKTYPDLLNATDFNNACGVITDYCKTGGTYTFGGSGLK